MLRPGLHFHNGCAITPADVDVVRRWSPLSLLEVMDGQVNDQGSVVRDCWEYAGRPPVVLRRYYEPREGGPAAWGAHAEQTLEMVYACHKAGIPVDYLMVKPFNEPNMPEWAQWEGFGDKPDDMRRYNEALLIFVERVRREMPGVRVGGPHLTVGNRDVRFSSDPGGVYYYHGEDGTFESSPCAEALAALDVHFVHCYGMHPGQYADRAHGLRFLEYEKYLQGKDIYIVEGAYGINSGQPADQNTVRGEDTVGYLRLLGEKYPQVKGIALWIGGDPGAGWFSFCHSNGPGSESHRPVVYAVEAAGRGIGPEVEPVPDTEPEGDLDLDGMTTAMGEMVHWSRPQTEGQAYWKAGRVEVQPEADSFSLFAVLPDGAPVAVKFAWLGGSVIRYPKADPLAPRGAREWAASMPMFAPRGSYEVSVVGNSEAVGGLGLYRSDLDHRYKGHHPVLVWFDYVEGSGVEPEPVEPEPSPPSPLPPGEAGDYKLAKAWPRHGIETVCDLRDEIESFSDMVTLERCWRPFKLIRMAVVHHSGSSLETQTPLSIARYRVLEKDDPTIPYHFVIGWEGELSFTARLCWALPNSGKAAVNAESVSVCVMGDYRNRAPNGAQLSTLRRLLWSVMPEFLGGGWGQYRGLYVVPHGRLVATECPGEQLVDALVWQGAWEMPPFRADVAAGEWVHAQGPGGGVEYEAGGAGV